MRKYGAWAGNPKGYVEDVSRCIVEVANEMMFYQCSRKRRDGLYCRQHAKMIAAGTLSPLYIPEDTEAS